MPTTQEYALLANRVYMRTDENRSPVPTGWTEAEWVPDGTILGFSAGVYQKGNDIVISYTGTNEQKVADFAVANIPITLGMASPSVLQAMSLYLRVKSVNPTANITFTGHSLGAGLASLMAVFFDRPAIVFDEAAFQITAMASTFAIAELYSALLLVTGGLTDPAFNVYDYSTSAFYRRESNVTLYSVEHEVLESTRFDATSISGNGSGFIQAIGSQTILNDFSGRVALHSMTLLAAMLESEAFKAIIPKLPDLLKLIFDDSLYSSDPQKSNAVNFIDKLYIAQVGKSKIHLLDRFSADLQKLIQTSGTASYSRLTKALIVATMDYYYLKDPVGATSLFAVDGSAINFNYSDIGGRIQK